MTNQNINIINIEFISYSNHDNAIFTLFQQHNTQHAFQEAFHRLKLLIDHI